MKQKILNQKIQANAIWESLSFFFFFKILYEDSFQKLIDKFVYLYYLLKVLV